MKGLTLSHALLPGGINMVRQLIPLDPEELSVVARYDALRQRVGATSYAWSMLRPLLPKNTQRKVHIHGAGAAQSLTEEVRPDFLPEQLGGRAACPELRPPVSLEEHDRGVVGSPLRSPRQSPRAGPRSIEVEVNETNVPTAVVVPGVEYVLS